MQQTILGVDQNVYRKKIKNRTIICIAVAIVMVAFNVLFCLLRNDDNHKTMLALNIVFDILIGWFLIAFVSFAILPQKRTLKIFKRKRTVCKGEVVEISTDTQRVQGFDCYSVSVGVESKRTLFLPNTNEFHLEVGKVAQFFVVSNIIVEVCYE